MAKSEATCRHRESKSQSFLVSDDIEKILAKKKFQNFFDIAVVGFMGSRLVTIPEFGSTFLKENSLIYVETANYICTLRKKERDELNTKLQNAAANLNLVSIPYDKKHHYKYQKIGDGKR
eukprot:TRINITY_DN5984_c0_g2_i9.p1 TRINITY_DN5984_c0_g2~~TRINITY_DN5984_c0_g2_i9.p1  ORF type:complete len:120 (+),score=25.98 TRINITY_DN5984_c0_g2_i9:920-1279(+)